MGWRAIVWRVEARTYVLLKYMWGSFRRLGYAKVAQLVEHSTENAGVVGSIPSLGIFVFEI